MSEAFSCAADMGDSSQVILLFPTLQKELALAGEVTQDSEKIMAQQNQDSRRQNEEEQRNALKADWLRLLFTGQSEAALNPEEPLRITSSSGNGNNPSGLVVWFGDKHRTENTLLKDLSKSIENCAFMSVAWSEHPAGEAFEELNLSTPEVTDGTWYLRDKNDLGNEDLDLLHDVEMLGRCFITAVEGKLKNLNLRWGNVIILGFGKAAGVALYASLLNMIPQQVSAMILFSPIVVFPVYMGEKMQALPRSTSVKLKLFAIWGGRNRSTPGSYRQMLLQIFRRSPGIHCTTDVLPESEHAFDSKCLKVLTSLLPLCLPR